MYRLRTRPGCRFPGLGFTYDDLASQAGIESCSPQDTTCVRRNGQRMNAVQDLWGQYLYKPDTASLPVPKLMLTLVPDQEALASWNNNQPVEAGITLDGKVLTMPTVDSGFGVLSTTLGTSGGLNPSPVTGQSMTPRPVSTTTTTPKPATTATSAPSAVINSSGGQNAPETFAQTQAQSTTAGSGLSFASLPWYVWVGGGVLVLMAMKEGR